MELGSTPDGPRLAHGYQDTLGTLKQLPSWMYTKQIIGQKQLSCCVGLLGGFVQMEAVETMSGLGMYGALSPRWCWGCLG